MVKETILLVEDNRSLLDINQKMLRMEGYRVLCSATLRQAQDILRRESVQLIILDVLLPDGSGVEFCRALRAENGVPVLFLTALANKQHLLAGLKAGGDDYVAKPCDLEVMAARVRSLLRRVDMDRAETSLAFGPLELRTVAGQAFLYGNDLLLSQKEFSVLHLLAQNEGVVVPKERVYETVWGQPMQSDSQALYAVASRLKRKLQPARRDGITFTARRGQGYCFALAHRPASPLQLSV